MCSISFQDPFPPSLSFSALWRLTLWIMYPRSFADRLALGSAIGSSAGILESWRERSQDMSHLFLPNFFPPQSWLLSAILLALLILLLPSALVPAELPPFSLLSGSLSIPCLFFPLTLLSTLYIFLSCKSLHLNYFRVNSVSFWKLH